MKSIKIFDGVFFYPDDNCVLNPECAGEANNVIVIRFENCRDFKIPTLLWFANRNRKIEHEVARFYNTAKSKFPSILEIEKKQVGPVLDPGKTHYSNYPACAEAPRIVFDQAYDYDWSIDSDPTCKIIREKNSR